MTVFANKWCFVAAFLLMAILYAAVVLMPEEEGYPKPSKWFTRSSGDQEDQHSVGKDDEHLSYAKNQAIVPDLFFKNGVYSNSDFTNEAGVTPTFWNENETGSGQSMWGPCYPPTAEEEIVWKELIENANKSAIHYLLNKNNQRGSITSEFDEDTIPNYCRPGFLIIGQGKCGTSSLYHYLTQHPRVLPASEKQVHYFKYYSHFGLRWYYGHFPSTTSFLSKGALMTGEASPGYLPYPDVVALTRHTLPGTKMICLGRHPLERSWSSYRYNYVHPGIDAMKRGKAKGIPRGLSDEEYKEKYLYSFEDMLKAELALLRNCLASGGEGETGAVKSYGKKRWAQEAFASREENGLPPLIDLDGQCYGDLVSMTVPRKQWQSLVDEKPGKFLRVQNLHLSQSMIGRSLYTYPLEWWYAMFPKNQIYFLCTEEMQDFSGDPISNVADFLGLPRHNFSGIVQEGMYNVGGHKGYDKITTWEEVAGNQDEEDKEEIPISPEFRKEMMEFYSEHNERLFQLTGRRCNWQ